MAEKRVTAYPTPFLEQEGIALTIQKIRKKEPNSRIALLLPPEGYRTEPLLAALKRYSLDGILFFRGGEPVPEEAEKIFFPACTVPPYPEEGESVPDWFETIFKSKKDLFISYPLANALGEEIHRSPWLNNRDCEFQFDSPEVTKVGWMGKPNLRSSKARPLLEKYLKENCFSPTELETYLDSPFKHFAKYLLKLRSLEERKPELDPGKIGALVHKILEAVFSKLGPGIKKEAEDPPSFFKKGRQIIEQELALWEKENLPQGSSLWNPQKERILRALKAVLEQEIVRFQQRPQKLTPMAFEKRLNPPLPLRCGSETIQMGGVIDRIDVDPEEKKFLVIDYKT
ncbi:MAG: PD-(D/E)XK nuclease family protein, partial [bacterium]|nr:PD-(D/E)XK nuclease family protein [bacterium]